MNERNEEETPYVKRHLRFGWWLILVFLTLGAALEYMHGYKLGLLLDVSNETRRLLWRLAHAHGALLGLLNIGFAATLVCLRDRPPRRRGLVSFCLIAGSVLLPLGFFLGGIIVYESDPWPGVLLSPVGAVFLFVGVLVMALGAGGSRSD